MSVGVKKLQEEFKYIRKSSGLANISGTVAPYKKDFLHWFGCFMGPKNTPYSDGIFYFEIKFTKNYPNEKPEVQMRTPIYHPNIYNGNGHVCVSYLNEWKNTYDIIGIVNAIYDILDEPNTGDSYLIGFDKKKAEEFKKKYATENQDIDWKNSWGKGWSL